MVYSGNGNRDLDEYCICAGSLNYSTSGTKKYEISVRNAVYTQIVARHYQTANGNEYATFFHTVR